MNAVSRRQIHSELLSLLQDEDLGRSMAAFGKTANSRMIAPLFSFFYRDESWLRWRAITAMGEAVMQMAGRDIEYARNIMRRLIWNLNDESGGIGWGSAEAMGEIMARVPQLAEEYGPLLASYIREDRNRPDHPDLQAGALGNRPPRPCPAAYGLRCSPVPRPLSAGEQADPERTGRLGFTGDFPRVSKARVEIRRKRSGNPFSLSGLDIFGDHRGASCGGQPHAAPAKKLIQINIYGI